MVHEDAIVFTPKPKLLSLFQHVSTAVIRANTQAACLSAFAASPRGLNQCLIFVCLETS